MVCYHNCIYFRAHGHYYIYLIDMNSFNRGEILSILATSFNNKLLTVIQMRETKYQCFPHIDFIWAVFPGILG